MPPCIMSSQMASYTTDPKRSLVCCDPLGHRMAKILPGDLSRSSPTGKFNHATMLLGCMVQLAMDWVRKWLHLWQDSPTTLMKAVLMGIAKLAMPVWVKIRQLLSEGETYRREKSKMEKQNFPSHPGYLFLNSVKSYLQTDTESLVEDGCFEEGLEHFLIVSSDGKMDMLHLDSISEPGLINSSISCNFRNNWEDYSEEEDDDDVELADTGILGNFPQKRLEHCYYPQALPKRLNTGGCFGNKLKDNSSHHEEFEGFFWHDLESTPDSQEKEKSLEFSEDMAMSDGKSFKGASDPPKDGEELEAYKKDGDTGALNSVTSTISDGFKSPLVLSLFYSPSEEDEDEGEDSEDWWTEDVEESGLSQTYVDDRDSGNEKNCLETEVESLHQDVLENLCESFFVSSDPFHPLSFSRPLPVHKNPTSALSEPKSHEEITVSFYLSRLDSKPEELSHPHPKQPWPMRDPRATSRHPAHKCCQLDSRKKCNFSIPTETSLASQEANWVIKRVRFSPEVTVHPLVVWDYASRAARRGPWEEMARDRCRFHRRIAEVGAILEPFLGVEHRAKAWRRIYGIPDSLQEEENGNSSAEAESRASLVRNETTLHQDGSLEANSP